MCVLQVLPNGLAAQNGHLKNGDIVRRVSDLKRFMFVFFYWSIFWREKCELVQVECLMEAMLVVDPSTVLTWPSALPAPASLGGIVIAF